MTKLIKDYPEGTQWQTRDGRPVRVLCTDAAGDFPVVGLVKTYSGGRDVPMAWTDRGEHEATGFPERALDLIPVPVKRTGWVNLYPPDHQYCDVSTHGVCRTKEDADYAASVRDIPRVACIQIEWTEGEGLS